jgi:hypothetical protein
MEIFLRIFMDLVELAPKEEVIYLKLKATSGNERSNRR